VTRRSGAVDGDDHDPCQRGTWLWLFGQPGVGKSATGFRLFQRLAENGVRVAFIEIDQIGMCMPAPDSARSTAKADNLLAVLDIFSEAGASVIVTGDIVETMHDVLNRAPTQPVLCRLRADDEVTTERLTARGGPQYAMSSRIYGSFDVPDADVDVTTHASVDEVVDEIVRTVGPWPGEINVVEAEAASAAPTPVPDADVILITGPRAVGTSTVAWQVLIESIAVGCPTGFLDLDQLGFLSAATPDLALGVMVANVTACWAGFRAQGAKRLVLCGHADDREVSTLRGLLPSLRVVALTATSDTLLERARWRREHRDIELPGDDLFGEGDDYLRDIVFASQTCLTEDADVTLGTDALQPVDIAARITPMWPAIARQRSTTVRIDRPSRRRRDRH
jgi:gluconate kinase